MNNKFLGKLIIFLIIILLIISIAIIITIYYLNASNMQSINNNNIEEGGEDFTESYGKGENGGIDKQSYYDINACMKKYLNAINLKSEQYGSYDENENYITTSPESEIKQKIYNLLSQNYITENNITVENVNQHIKIVQESTTFVLLEAFLVQDADIKSFLVQGLIESAENYDVIDTIFAVINIDFFEDNFSIEPIYKKYNNINEIKIENFESGIIPNEDNKMMSPYVKIEDIPEEYINLYKRLTLGYPEKMYELLDEKYKNAKFGSIDEFKNYVEKNKAKIKMITLDKYQVITDNNEIQYICVDQNENYYIFKQNEIFQDYTVLLDTYTIDLPEFTEKYTVAKDQEKAGMNIEKVLEAINQGDYRYIYSKLDNTFKKNNFPKENDLQEYIQKNFEEKNTIEYLDFSQEGDICIYKTKINGKNFNIIMQLGEGTEFTMSFSFE